MNPDWNEKLEQAILLPEIGSARANVPQSLGNSPEKSPEKMEDYQDSDIKLSALSDESASIPATESYLQGQSRNSLTLTNELLTARFNDESESQLKSDEMQFYDQIVQERNHKLATSNLRFVNKNQDYFAQSSKKHWSRKKTSCCQCSTFLCMKRKSNSDAT